MNIFDQYLNKIKKILLDLSKNGDLILPDKLDGITTEIPPSKFNSDISTNVAMVLSKLNKKNPKKFISKKQLSSDKYRAISDFISGMTDRYAINLYSRFK